MQHKYHQRFLSIIVSTIMILNFIVPIATTTINAQEEENTVKEEQNIEAVQDKKITEEKEKTEVDKKEEEKEIQEKDQDNEKTNEKESTEEIENQISDESKETKKIEKTENEIEKTSEKNIVIDNKQDNLEDYPYPVSNKATGIQKEGGIEYSNITKNIEYKSVEDNGIKVKFTKLPESTFPITLNIKLINIGEKVKGKDIVSPAYEITTTPKLQNGEFEAEISLYTESIEKDIKVNSSEDKLIYKEEKINKKEGKFVNFKVDHFTVFVLTYQDANYTPGTDWSDTLNPQGYDQDGDGIGDGAKFTRLANGNAMWEFTTIDTKNYEIYISWTAFTGNRTTNAQYSLYESAGNLLVNESINQQLLADGSIPSIDREWSGWYRLGGTNNYALNSNSYLLLESTESSTATIADAVKLIPVGQIQGRTFVDQNNNGLLLGNAAGDGDHPNGMQDGYEVRLYNDSWNLIDSQTTNTTGNVGQYQFNNLNADNKIYYVCGADKVGYLHSPATIGQTVVDTNNNPVTNYADGEIVSNSSGASDESSVCWQVNLDANDTSKANGEIGAYLGIGYTLDQVDNLGWNLNDGSTNYGDTPPSINCSSGPVWVDGSQSLSNVWSHPDSSNPNIKYIRLNTRPNGQNPLLLGQTDRVNLANEAEGDDPFIIETLNDSYLQPNSGGWGSFGGAQGQYTTKVRAFYDMNSNNKYDNGENLSDWSNTCTIWYIQDLPTNPNMLGYNVQDGTDTSNDYDLPRPNTEISCGGATNINSISNHWTDSLTGNTSLDSILKYNRQYQRPNQIGTNNWSGNERYTNPYTNFRTFGGNPGIEGTYNTRVRAFYDINNNGQLDTSEPVSNWSGNDCYVTYDISAPTTPTWTNTPIFTHNGDNVAGTRIAMSFNESTDLGTGIDHYEYQYVRRDLAGNALGNGQTNMNGLLCTNGICTWRPTAQQNSQWVFRMRAVDEVGNKSSWSNWDTATDAEFFSFTFDYDEYASGTGIFARSDYDTTSGNASFITREDSKPISTITNPTSTYYTNNSSVNIDFEAYDNGLDTDEDTEVKKVELYYEYNNSGTYNYLTEENGNTGTFSANLNDGDGTYCFYTIAEDIADDQSQDLNQGNREDDSTKSCDLEIVLDTTAPTVSVGLGNDGIDGTRENSATLPEPVVNQPSNTAPNHGDFVNESVAIYVTADDDNMMRYHFRIIEDGDTEVGKNPGAGNGYNQGGYIYNEIINNVTLVNGQIDFDNTQAGIQDFDTTLFADGTYWLIIGARDMANNRSASINNLDPRIKIIVDNTPPEIPDGLEFIEFNEDGTLGNTIECGGSTNNIIDDNPTVKHDIRINWNDVDDLIPGSASGLNHYVYQVTNPLGSVWETNRNQSYYDGDFRAGDGVYSIVIKSVDNLGNESDWSQTCTIRLDTTPPASEITNPINDTITGNHTQSFEYSVIDNYDATVGSGVEEVEIYVNYNGGTYNLYDTIEFTGDDTGVAGIEYYSTFDYTFGNDGEYCFYTRARDEATNYENAPQDADTCIYYQENLPSIQIGNYTINESDLRTYTATSDQSNQITSTYSVRWSLRKAIGGTGFVNITALTNNQVKGLTLNTANYRNILQNYNITDPNSNFFLDDPINPIIKVELIENATGEVKALDYGQVTINNIMPTVNLSASANGTTATNGGSLTINAGDTVSFSGSFSDPAGNFDAGPAWQARMNYGNGYFGMNFSHPDNTNYYVTIPSQAYAATRNATLRVCEENNLYGFCSTAVITINVINPTGTGNVNIPEGAIGTPGAEEGAVLGAQSFDITIDDEFFAQAGEEYTFTINSTDYDIADLTCEWDFGDGSDEITTAGLENGRYDYTYNQEGTYDLSVTCSNEDGEEITKSSTVYVGPEAAQESQESQNAQSEIAGENIENTQEQNSEESGFDIAGLLPIVLLFIGLIGVIIIIAVLARKKDKRY